ncbi:phenylacetate--CoA ligase [bacterium]|nr:phenylacetate--CoA ligase [bacterium]
MIWDPKHECMDVEERRKLQLFRLREQLARLWAAVPFYRERWREARITPDDIQSLDDLPGLPFTVKNDLRDTYPTGMFATPLDEVVRVHASSGTTGKPIVVGYTKGDLEGIWAETIARTLAMGGGTSRDILQIAYGYGLFTGGLGLHYGGERLGCTVIPMSSGNTERQLLMMRDLGATMLGCTPSYALTLADAAEDAGLGADDFRLRAGIFGAEAWSEGARAAVEAKFGLSAHDIYGLTEIIGPGVAAECECKGTMHVFDDHFYPEVIDPETLQPLPEGQVGELVFTTLTKRAFPVIRYRTRDISALHYEPCPCGRTHPRISRITGRTDDMLIIRGVNVFPSQIEHVLTGVKGVEPQYQLVLTRAGRLDALEVQVEVSPQFFSDTIAGLEHLEQEIGAKIRSTLGISVKVKLVEPKTIERSVGKAKRVIDLRDKA